ncbi:MAG: FAD-dependent oxidoreductase [Ruminococcaceae bacterium]|nr:FAD-dependent oxidoreductase [Oscillospiraceae bacterium]
MAFKRQFPHLCAPLQLGRHTFKNRMLMAPHNTPLNMNTSGNFFSDDCIAYYEERARGGAAQVTIGETLVDHPTVVCASTSILTERDQSFRQLISLAEMASRIHWHGALASIELVHPGAHRRVIRGLVTCNPVGPSAYDPDRDEENFYHVRPGVHVDECSPGQMQEICQAFASAARVAKRTGFDGVMIHAGHGWLQAQFLSPHMNRRRDEYGGSLENRARFPLQLLRAVREAVGKDFLIEYRISGDELVAEGTNIDDTVAFCRMAEPWVDLFHISAGVYHLPVQSRTFADIFTPHACNADLAARVKQAVNVPVVTVGAISDPAEAEQLLADGKADFVALGRQMIADPAYAAKVMENRPQDIAPCIRCFNCMSAVPPPPLDLKCAVNPRAAHEERLSRAPQPGQSRKVIVVGGGPGGMTAAITAARRGHRVQLFEQSDHLGGALCFAGADPHKADLHRFKEHLVSTVRSLDIDVHLNRPFRPEDAEVIEPYAILEAVGARPRVPDIPGLEHSRNVLDVYEEDLPAGASVLILGGGLVACEAGLFLADKGHRVTLAGRNEQIAPDCNAMHRQGLLPELEKKLVFHTGLACVEIRENGALCQTREGELRELKADIVICAMGMESRSVPGLEQSAPFYRRIGDCVRPGRVVDAVSGGFFAAMDIL